ncbi:hypothetical protein FRAAL1599 [Frankia alni ACN14a]|uniref:Uncharacterized protein n=1 Tax=Frankia alni (strain DSM 45986 / CECT 9034 / ACN14a) TaxID=326424 RepID=Q0RQC2_FRAAA|nr:hypothetical protein FRAAL1599 [Frankia alni ACN14a]
MPLTCAVALPPNRCKISVCPLVRNTLDLHLYYGVADHPWRDRNCRRPCVGNSTHPDSR